MNEESCEGQSNPSSGLELTLDKMVNIFTNHGEEVKALSERKLSLDWEIQTLKELIQQLEVEKADLEAEITALKLRNTAYQKEHTNLRNSITVVKFQIEKIKESISKTKSKGLKDLEDFEKAVDEISEKFRSGPSTYDRKNLLEKIEKQKERQEFLVRKLQEVTTALEKFNNAKGLRGRTGAGELLVDCILPGSELAFYLGMMETLDDVLRSIKDTVEGDGKYSRNAIRNPE